MLSVMVATVVLAGPPSAAAAGWRLQHVAQGPGAPAAVSCPSPTRCVAVGNTGQSVFFFGPWAAEWSRQAGWIAQSLPAPSTNTASLTAVSCRSTTDCVAVGSGQSSTGAIPVGVAYRFDGAWWTSLLAPPGLPAAVSCSPGSCIAVGTDDAGHAAAWSWDGRRWTALVVPQPAGASLAVLSAVSCVSPASCVAVGTATGDGGVAGLAERWDGRRWTITPVPDGFSVRLSGVSCASARVCLAVGSAGDAAARRAVALRWNGAAWSATKTPSLGTPSRLTAVSCRSPRDCTAVGQVDRFTLAETWNGARWSPETTANPPFQNPALPSYLAALTSVSCLDGTCTALGTSAQPIDGFAPVAERASSVAPAAPPRLVSHPVILGRNPAQPGDALQCNEGVWNAAAPVAYTFAWVNGRGAVLGSGATLTVAAGAGSSIRCRVTASDVAGAAAATSAPVSVGTSSSAHGRRHARGSGSHRGRSGRPVHGTSGRARHVPAVAALRT